jgi:hypothetical protein
MPECTYHNLIWNIKDEKVLSGMKGHKLLSVQIFTEVSCPEVFIDKLKNTALKYNTYPKPMSRNKSVPWMTGLPVFDNKRIVICKYKQYGIPFLFCKNAVLCF